MKINAQNKQALLEFLESRCPVADGAEALDICLELLPNLGSTDAELRDGLTYTILAKMIMNEPRLQQEQLTQLLMRAIDSDHLFFKIGETGKNSVFLRTFSILIVAAVLERDNRDELLPEQVVHQAIAATFQYAIEERDKRGYVAGKGWAHSVAHTSDAVDSCVQNRFATVEERDWALDVVRHLVMADMYLTHDEDARLALTVFRMAKFNRIETDILEDWLGGFAEKTYDASLQPSPSGWNAQSFLRRLYLQLEWSQTNPGLAAHVSRVLRSVDALAVQE